MLQHKMYGQYGKAGHDAYHALLAEDKPGEASLLPYFQDTFQHKMYGQHGKAGHDEFKKLVENNPQSLVRDTQYYKDTWQYVAYGTEGTPETKRSTRRCENMHEKS